MLHQALERLVGSVIQPLRPEPKGALEAVEDPLLSFSTSPQSVRALKNDGYTNCHSFVAIPSRSLPRWVLPIGDRRAMAAATDIYKPHKMAPRLGKRIVAEMMTRGCTRWLGSRLLLASKTPSPLESLVQAVTGEQKPVFALSFGRLAAVRKLTVQVMRPDGEILGYIKLPLTEPATERVRHEAAVLERLSTFPKLLPHIPRLLHAGEWSDGYMLFQSPLQGKPGPTAVTRLHEIFFETLWSVYRLQRSGLSLVEEVGTRWQNAVRRLDSTWEVLGKEVLHKSAEYLARRTVSCGICHGDFAPWNTRRADGRLFVFDWESTQWDAPGSWDLFHFTLQTEVSSLKTERCRKLLATSDVDGSYMLYLLNSVMQFLHEDNLAAAEHRRHLLTEELKKPISKAEPERSGTVQWVRSRHKEDAIMASAAVSPVLSMVTTSWDDGDPSDKRLSELLSSRNLAGTFYIPMSGYLRRPTLTSSEIRDLSSAGFEIGAHSVSHESLTHLQTRREVKHEVRTSKHALEHTIGKEVPMFCYPNGRYDERVIKELKAAGYKGARTTRMLSITSAFNPFEVPTTLQAYPHPRIGYVRDLVRARNVSGLWRFTTELSGIRSWLELGKLLFGQVLEQGGIWHLYGHSWEIEELGLWSEVSELLDHVARHDRVLYVTNSQVLSMVANHRGATSAE